MKVTITDGVNIVCYTTDMIEEIICGRYEDFYTREYVDRNNLDPCDSLLMIKLKNGMRARFNNKFTLTFG